MKALLRGRAFLTALFVLLSLALGVGGYALYRQEARAILAQQYQSLRAIGALKVSQILSWRNDLLQDARMHSAHFGLRDQIAPATASPPQLFARDKLQQALAQIRAVHGYRNAALLDLDGRVLLAAGPGLGASEQLQIPAAQALRPQDPVLGDLVRDAQGQVFLDTVAPVLDPQGRLRALLLLRTDPAVRFFPFIQTWPTPSATAETLLVERRGDRVLFLNKLRHREDPPLTFSTPFSQQDLPAARALAGQTGAFSGVDYRGVAVLADLQAVPGSSWALVSKADAQELLAEVGYRKGVILAFVGVGILLLGLLGLLVRARLQRAQRAMVHSEGRFQGLYEGLRDAYVQVDMAGRIQACNGVYRDLLGYSAEELQGLTYEDLTPVEWHAFEARIVREEVLPLGYSGVYEKTYRRKDGTVFPVELRTVLLRGEAGEPVGMWAILRDITERKAAEDQIKATQAELQRLLAIGEQSRQALLSLVEDQQRSQAEVHRLNVELEQRVLSRTQDLTVANKELEAFAYSVSHDLRAPLRHMDGFLSLLARHLGDGLDEQGAHYLGVAQGASVRMGHLVDGLLAFSRLGRAELHVIPIEAVQMVASVIEEFQGDCAQRGVQWVVGPLQVLNGDPTLLRLVFQNLLGNAMKFTRNHPQAVIEVQPLEGLEGERGFVVRDNGVGFDPAYTHKLFGVFQRLHREEEFEGTGIGLANVHRIVTRHGGRVWAEGSLGQGAAFFVTLPWQGRTS